MPVNRAVALAVAAAASAQHSAPKMFDELPILGLMANRLRSVAGPPLAAHAESAKSDAGNCIGRILQTTAA